LWICREEQKKEKLGVISRFWAERERRLCVDQERPADGRFIIENVPA
jgi:hypothetical protein